MAKLHPSVWLHFGAGVLIGVLFFLFPYYELKEGWVMSTVFSIAGGVLFGSLKEWSDWSKRKESEWKKWDWMDWLFTVLGSLAVPFIVGLIELAL